MQKRREHSGFTLIELVLVLLIIGTCLAMASPSLRGWSRGSKVRDAGDQFLSIARYGRTAATADARVYRLQIDAPGGTYQLLVQDGEQFTHCGTDFSRVFTLPQGAVIEVMDLQ